MLIKTQGLVLGYIRYRESSIITRIYTREVGVQSYVVNSVRGGGKSPARLALFQPFTLLDLVAYPAKKGGGLTRLSEYRLAYAYHSVPYDIRKSSVVMFLSEVVSRAVREEEANDVLFNYLREQLIGFDLAEAQFENFPLTFLLGLSQYLGFAPRSGDDLVNQLLAGGLLQPSNQRKGSHGVDQVLSELEKRFEVLLRGTAAAVAEAVPNGRERRELLHLLLAYYRLHVENLGAVKSLDILSEVLGG
jgi:DNA repair protein RecO (recombination protein O)